MVEEVVQDIIRIRVNGPLDRWQKPREPTTEDFVWVQQADSRWELQRPLGDASSSTTSHQGRQTGE